MIKLIITIIVSYFMKTADESKRSIVKALTYRAIIIALDIISIYLLTGRIDVALSFMIVSNLYTTVAYYIHERLWNLSSWGKK